MTPLSDSATAPAPALAGAGHPPAVSLEGAWPWALLGVALLALVYLVGLDEGAASAIPGHSLHEWLHDGRHLLGFPCH
jgi:hypothetical protein